MATTGPYKDEATNRIYNLLFCDDLNLYKSTDQSSNNYPFDILFSATSTIADLQKIIDDADADPRIKVLAYNKQIAKDHTPTKKELLAVIVEVGLDEGLDVLASFANATARYINQTGKLIVWEDSTNETVRQLTQDLFTNSINIVKQIGPWDQPRKPFPGTGNVRITFLVSDGLYFGEAPIEVLFDDAMAGPALASATALLQFLTSQSSEK